MIATIDTCMVNVRAKRIVIPAKAGIQALDARLHGHDIFCRIEGQVLLCSIWRSENDNKRIGSGGWIYI